MPIDARIPLGIVAPQFEGPLDLAAKYQAMQSGQMQNRLAQRHIQALDTADARTNALASIAQSAYNPATGGIDPVKYKTGLIQGGHIDEASKFDTEQGVKEIQAMDLATKRMTITAQAISPYMNLKPEQVTPEANAQYQQTIQGLEQQFKHPIDALPRVLDLEKLAPVYQQGISVLQQMQQKLDAAKAAQAQANSDRSYGLQKQEFGLKQQTAEEAKTEQSFTPGAIDNAAARYNMDGTLPPMGMGKSGALGRSAILNRAAELAQGTSGGDQRVNQMGFKANSQALGQLQKQQTMVSSFERNANKNLDLALSLGDKVDKTGIPIVNKWIQSGQKNITGDADIAAFHAANETFVNEYAKVMSGSMGNTAVSDSARQHAHELLSTAQSPEQYKAVANTLKKDMANRMSGFDDEKAALNQTMKGGKAAAPPAGDNSANAAPMTATNPQTGERVQSTDGGQSWHAIK